VRRDDILGREWIALTVGLVLALVWAMTSTGLLVMFRGPDPLPAPIQELNRHGWPGVPAPANRTRRAGTVVLGSAILFVLAWMPLEILFDSGIQTTQVERLISIFDVLFILGWLAFLAWRYLGRRRGA
jgi:hypothetical protein